MTDSVIDTLTAQFQQQQTAITSLTTAVQQRQDSITALNAAFQASQDSLTSLSKKLQADSTLPKLVDSVNAGNQQLGNITASLKH